MPLDEQMIEVLERLTRIETKLSNGFSEDLKDHERRLRWLEKGFWTALGALVILQIVLKFIPPFPWIGQ